MKSVSHSVVPDSPHGLQPARLLCPWDFPGKDSRVVCHFRPQGIFLTQGSNPCLLFCRQVLYILSYQGRHTTKGLESHQGGLFTFHNRIDKKVRNHKGKDWETNYVKFLYRSRSHEQSTINNKKQNTGANTCSIESRWISMFIIYNDLCITKKPMQ